MSRRGSSRKPSRERSSRGYFRARFETLESRTLLAVFNLTAAGGDAALRSAIQAADSNVDTGNTINLAAGNYLLTNTADGGILIQSGNPHTLTIVGKAATTTIIEPAPTAPWNNRIFDVEGSNTTVVFENLTIEGGNFRRRRATTR